MISFQTLQYNIELSRHALFRAFERGITTEFIEATVKGGTQELFGKNRVRFIRRYRKFTLICIGEIRKNSIITILTVETRRP